MLSIAETGEVSGASAARAPLVTDSRPDWTIVVLDDGATPLPRRGAELLRDTVEAWSGVALPVCAGVSAESAWAGRPAIVLSTLDRVRAAAPELADLPLLARAASLDDQGFVCAPARIGGVTQMVVTARTPRGVYNGAVYLCDFCVDGPRDGLYLTLDPVVRMPRLAGRAVYLLTIWGHEAEYTAADWERVFDSFARDGVDRVYFWLSGHFPSGKFPATYRCKDGPYDSTERSGIPTVEDQRRLIRAAHERGLAFYLGGALGGWCGTRFLTDLKPETMKTPPEGAPYPEEYSLCPSHPTSRANLVAYYKEMFDALPEADGLFIESADEWGGCVCPRCRRPVDDLGSTEFGQAQLSLLVTLMETIWQDHPHARLAYTIGYDEHDRDPAYYARVREMADPRFEWMEARDKWVFPGPGGEPRPAAECSPRIMRWRQYYALPLEALVRDAERVSRGGMYGLITAFEPGAGTGSVYTAIPYPTDLLPYVLTGFVYREATWEPDLPLAALEDKVRRRFLGTTVAEGLADDLWALREHILAAVGANGLSPDVEQALAAIEGRARAARDGAGPKARSTLDLMQRAIDDLRAHWKTRDGD